MRYGDDWVNNIVDREGSLYFMRALIKGMKRNYYNGKLAEFSSDEYIKARFSPLTHLK